MTEPIEAAAIPAGVYFLVENDNFYSVERGCGCGSAFYQEWKGRWREFPDTKEQAEALMPPWEDMKSAPRNATEIMLRIPAKNHHYAVIGHWAAGDGSEQPTFNGWFRDTGYGFAQLDEPTGWRWPVMVAPLRRPAASGDLRIKPVDENTPYPSTSAMKAAVELEIHAALGSVQTVVIGKLIQQAIDAEIAFLPGRDDEAIRAEERERCASEIERRNWPCVGDARRIAADLRTLKTERGS